LVLSIEATPMFLGSLSKLEDHGESGLDSAMIIRILHVVNRGGQSQP
jgi:hypothetical protein